MKTIFFDESGKTGTQRYNEKWNFSSQPYFALCGIIVPDENIERLNSFLTEICTTYQVQGGELKFTKKAIKNHLDKISKQIRNKQEELNCKLMVEIVNKKYCVAMMITDYCVFPYYDTPSEAYQSPKGVLLRCCFANYIHDFISDKLLGEFVEFFDCGSQEIQPLIQLCLKLISESKNEAVKNFITETIDSLSNYKNLELLKKHVFPLLDKYRGGESSVAVCPHINSFNNIIMVRIDNLEELSAVHDKVPDLEEALKEDVCVLLNMNQSDFLNFANSKDTAGLQLADFWCGYIREAVQHFLIDSKKIPSELIDLVNSSVNFVGTFDEQSKLFPQNFEVAQARTCYYDLFKKADYANRF